jgi:Asp-tRNA(Asn)/Glu-tRNA(Gln) amidotransferase A subunit family amidase
VASAVRDGELETAVDMGTAIRAGAVTSVELVERALARAERWQPVTNALSQLWADEALEEARRVDAAPGHDLPLLAGVPILVKDLYDVAGHETTGCCEAYRGTIASADASVIARLREARVVMIGKTNQHELAAGGTNAVSACGPSRNPSDPERITGGSSGGSGAAVAAGVVPFALGSDTGGSIRIPASLCGIFGLKPTHGRFPLDGVMPLAPSMDCPGPMAASLDDLTVLYQAMSPRPVDGDGAPAPADPPNRIAVPGGVFTHRVHDNVLRAVDAAAVVFRGAGMKVEPVDGSGIDHARSVWMDVCTPEFREAHPALRGDLLDLVAPSVREWLERGARISPEQRRVAARRREEVRAWFATILRDHDALLIPTTPYPAPRLQDDSVELGAAGRVDVHEVGPGYLTSSINLAGFPALNLPAARSDGMPVGVSLVGPPGAEASLLELARAWRHASGYVPARPPLPSPSS